MIASHKTPRGPGWEHLGDVPLQGVVSSGAYRHRSGITVLSTLVIAEMPDGGGTGPQWHVSVAAGRGAIRLPSRHELAQALAAFDMRDAEEDNHEPGSTRNYWQPVDPARRVDCQCKADEVLITEPSGRSWSNTRDGLCRGCTRAVLLGGECPLHGRPGSDPVIASARSEDRDSDRRSSRVVRRDHR